MARKSRYSRVNRHSPPVGVPSGEKLALASGLEHRGSSIEAQAIEAQPSRLPRPRTRRSGSVLEDHDGRAAIAIAYDAQQTFHHRHARSALHARLPTGAVGLESGLAHVAPATQL